MSKIINLEHSYKELKDRRKYKSKLYEKENSFVARLPYPLSIDTIIDIVERMGIDNEEIVLPELYDIKKKLR
tara:strand:- start:368 stop:583 length:216 start_codon:yes stop_codon:yes gene_type:complete